MHPALLKQEEPLQTPSSNWSRRAASGRSGVVLQSPAQGQASSCHPGDGAEQGARHLNPFLSTISATHRSRTQVKQLQGGLRGGQIHSDQQSGPSLINSFTKNMQVSPPARSGKCRSRSTHSSSLAATFPPLVLCKDKEYVRVCSIKTEWDMSFAILIIKHRLTILMAL